MCARAFPNETDFLLRFPIAAILPQIQDLYELSPEIWSLTELRHWQSWRRKSSKSLEQLGVLLAMAKDQAIAVYLSTYQRQDPRFNILEVPSPFKQSYEHSLLTILKPFLIVPDDQHVRIIRAQIPRQVFDALQTPNWSQSLQQLPPNVQIRIKSSVPLNTSQDDGLVALLSAMEAMLRRYDDMTSLFAFRSAPPKQILQSEEESASPQTSSNLDNEPSPERSSPRTRREDATTPSQASSVARKLSPDSSRHEPRQESPAYSQERTAISKSERSPPHPTSAARAMPASRVRSRHMDQAAVADKSPSPPSSKRR